MDKKRLIVVWPYRFRDFDWQRFELDYLAPHVEIRVHELLEALTPEFAVAYANWSENPAVQRFKSLKDWRRELGNVSKNAIVFSHVRPINLKSTLICWTLRRSKARVVGFLFGGAVVPGSQAKTLSHRALSRAYHFVRRNLLAVVMPDRVAVGGSEAERMGRRDFSRSVSPILASSFDYSRYLLNRNDLTENYERAVYLDTGFPGFPRDEVLTGRSEAINSSDWYPKLNKFFSFVETALKLKVEISIHPKHIGRDHKILFGERRTIGGNTPSMVASHQLVIATNSTAISFAICNDKPLILVWSDLIETGVDPRKKSFIENFSRETGARIFNIDREYSEQDLRDAMVIDQAKRGLYKRKYLTSRTDDKPNYQVLLDEVINVAD